LGNQATSILRDAAEEVISTLKDQNMRDPDRHDAISRLLTGKPARSGNGLSSEQYATLVQLGKALDDYDEYAESQKPSAGDGEDKVDDLGVAVVFDESDEEDKGNEEGGSDIEEDQVVEAASSSEEEDEEFEPPPKNVDDEDVEEEVIVQGGPEGTKKKALRATERVLSIHEIDAHFLQRQLSRHIDDADVSAKLAMDALSVLDIRNNSDVRECENKLLVLLGFDTFETIKLLLQNRVRIWACVSMKRAQNDNERNEIEAALQKEPSGEGMKVLEELHSKSKAEDWSRERLRGITDSLKSGKQREDGTGVSKALDSIGVKEAVQEDEVEAMDIDKEEAIELDLDSLAFRDGSHTMSNKKVNLPDKSWRAMKKGYEEVHVPAIRSVVPPDEKLVPIVDLPAWTRSAFKGK
jgi:pre-mRNA-splicing helicase BRR2